MKPIQAIGRDDQEERVQRQALEDQLMQMKNAAAEDIPQAIRSVEDKELIELHNDEQSEKGVTAALERLRGKKDTFDPVDEMLNANTDQVDREIEGLKRSIESMERRAMDTLDPEEAKSLGLEIRNARAQLRQKGNDAYRKLHARYSAMFSDEEPRRMTVRWG